MPSACAATISALWPRDGAPIWWRLSDLNEVTVEAVYSNGRHVAQGGKMIVPLAAVEPPLENTMKLAPLSADDFRIRVPGVASGRVLLQTIKGARYNSWSETEVEVRDGSVVVHRQSLPDGDCAPAWPQRSEARACRHRRLGPLGRGVRDLLFARNSHNLILYGHDAAELALAANTVIGMKGGIVVVKGGKVAAQLAYPVAGMLSLDRPERSRAPISGSWRRRAKSASGSRLPDLQGTGQPVAGLQSGADLTDLGLTDGTTKEIRPGLIRAL